MYNKKRAKEIAYAESKLPKDKLNWLTQGNALILFNENDRESFDKLNNISKHAVDFVNDGKELFIYSQNAGNGKTTWACKIALNYINQFIDSKPDNIEGCPIPMVLFINVPEFLLLKKMAIKDKLIEEQVNKIEQRASRASLVIWDDIASKGTTEYEDGILYIMLNKRIEHNKSNIFTSNVPIENLHEYLSGTVASRITRAGKYGNCIGLNSKGLRGYAFK